MDTDKIVNMQNNLRLMGFYTQTPKKIAAYEEEMKMCDKYLEELFEKYCAVKYPQMRYNFDEIKMYPYNSNEVDVQK